MKVVQGFRSILGCLEKSAYLTSLKEISGKNGMNELKDASKIKLVHVWFKSFWSPNIIFGL